MKNWARAACVWLGAGLMAVPFAHAEGEDAAPARGKTVVEIRTDRIILVDIVRTGDRLVAVGERGFAMLSDDAGKTWRARETPVTRTLTGVAFQDARVGVAVGHGGSLVRTEDGGENWTHVPLEEAGPDSLLGVVSLGGDHFIAYGAFGLYFDSTDAGKTWQRQMILSEDFDRHISQIVVAGESLLLVAESGILARSDDKGATWTAIESPYVGSYFGAIALQDGAILAFGMRGNVFRSADFGVTWQKLDLNTTASLNGGRQLADGRVLLVGNAGLLALSRDGGQTLELHWAPAGRGFAALAEISGSVVLAGEAGISVLDPAWLETR
ncbi:MAG: YCF48-related protein [Steroidobacteraceae bacterium]